MHLFLSGMCSPHREWNTTVISVFEVPKIDHFYYKFNINKENYDSEAE